MSGTALASIAVTLVTAGLLAQAEPRQSPQPQQPSACPETRAHIEPDLRTLPEDGDRYAQQRAAIHMPIEDVLALMGGVQRAYSIAEATRLDAAARIDAGAQGAELRYHHDTILRANALIEILDCLTGRNSA